MCSSIFTSYVTIFTASGVSASSAHNSTAHIDNMFFCAHGFNKFSSFLNHNMSAIM